MGSVEAPALARKAIGTAQLSRRSANQLRLLFYSLWIILSLFQAAYTELLNDEAYYWKLSSQLDWGYFEHPPLIALLIKCGSFVFKNELGVRLLPNLLTVGTIFLTEKLIQPKNLRLFYAIVSSIAILQIAGIFAVPDSPLIFFSVVFFMLLRKYLVSQSLHVTILLALSMALLVYSKHSGILVIAFSLLSDMRIFRKKTTWLVLFIALFLFLPHIIWQMNHNYATIRYHLFERSSKNYQISHTLNYILTQPFVLGPFMGILFMYSIFLFKADNLFERIIGNNAVAIFAFFLLMTFKGRVEANWTWIALFPMIYIIYKQAENRSGLRNLIYILFPITIVFIFASRVYLVWDFLPEGRKPKTELHNNRFWTSELAKTAGRTPVAFLNSSQKASKYEFYTGNKSFSINTGLAKKNQYYLWDSEYEFQGKKVLLVLDSIQKGLPTIKTSKALLSYKWIDNFQSFGNIRILPDKPILNTNHHRPINLIVKLCYMNENWRVFQSEEQVPELGYVIYLGNKKISEKTTGQKITADMFDGKECEVSIIPPSVSGEYDLYVAIINGMLPPQINGDPIKLIVSD